ncbi:hypothetical protein RF11_02284 [Thelohanellus kitauei]|uniref:Uncharacterized protein n=1 Tax=Thelohanellus kitauei TaxID=669202 RepID=A0A0C2IDS5_THEKT|nr:hypothetical protein RF11_02284 [Thelohanellus kitauei]
MFKIFIISRENERRISHFLKPFTHKLTDLILLGYPAEEKWRNRPVLIDKLFNDLYIKHPLHLDYPREESHFSGQRSPKNLKMVAYEKSGCRRQSLKDSYRQGFYTLNNTSQQGPNRFHISGLSQSTSKKQLV